MNLRDMDKYLNAVANNCNDLHQEMNCLSVQEEMEEFMFLGLRMISGVSKSKFEELFQTDFTKIYGEIVDNLKGKKLLDEDGDRIFLTEKGIDVSNLVMAEFLLS
jgi:oxygen-independent coproporphyrinogen-3 oxidase